MSPSSNLWLVDERNSITRNSKSVQSEGNCGSMFASGQAVVLGDIRVRYADGRVGSQKAIRINELQIGNHVVRNVLASVSGGPPLLSFPAINSIAPFTIDTRASVLIFHSTRSQI